MRGTPTLRKGDDDLRPSCVGYPQPPQSTTRPSNEVPILTMPRTAPSTAALRADLILQHSKQFADRAKAVLESTRVTPASTKDAGRPSVHPSSSVKQAHVLLEDARNETSRWKKYNDALESPTPSENGTRMIVGSTAAREWQRNLPSVSAVPSMHHRELSPLDRVPSCTAASYRSRSAEVTKHHKMEYPMLQRPQASTHAPSLILTRTGGVPPSLTAASHVRAISSREPAVPISDAPHLSGHHLAYGPNAPLLGEHVSPSPGAQLQQQAVLKERHCNRYISQAGRRLPPSDHSPSLASPRSAHAPLTHSSTPGPPALREYHTASTLRQKTLTLEQKLHEMESTLEAHKNHLRRIDQEACNASAFVAQIAHVPSLDEVAGCILRFAHNMKSSDPDAPNLSVSSLQLKSMLTMFPPFYTWLHHASLWPQWGLYVPIDAFERAVNAFFFADDVTSNTFGQLKNIIQARALPQAHPAWCAERSSVRGHVTSSVSISGTNSLVSSPRPSSRRAHGGEIKMSVASSHQATHAPALFASHVSHHSETSRYASVHSACSSHTKQPSAKNAAAWREEAEKWRHKYKKRARELDDALTQASHYGSECALWRRSFTELEETQQALSTARVNMEKQLAQVCTKLEGSLQNDVAANGDRIAVLDTRLRDEADARQEAQGQVAVLQEQLTAMKFESARLAHLHEVEVSNHEKQRAIHDEKQQLFNRVVTEKEEDIARRKHQFDDMEESMRSTEHRMEQKLEHQSVVESDAAEKLQFETQLRLRAENELAIVKEELRALRAADLSSRQDNMEARVQLERELESAKDELSLAKNDSKARIELEKELTEARLRIKMADGEVSLASGALSKEKEHTESLMARLRSDLDVAKKQTHDALEESAHAAKKFALQREQDQADRIALKNESVELRLESEQEIADMKQTLRHVEMEASSQSDLFSVHERLNAEKNEELQSRSSELQTALSEQHMLLNSLAELTQRASIADDTIAQEGAVRHELECRSETAEAERKRIEKELEDARRDTEGMQRQCAKELTAYEAEQSEMLRLKDEHKSAAFVWKGELVAEQEKCRVLESEIHAHASHRETIDRYKESLRAEHTELDITYRSVLEKNAGLEMEKQKCVKDFKAEIEKIKLEKYSEELGLQQQLLDAARSVKTHESEIERMRKLRTDQEKSLEKECADLKEQLKRLSAQVKYDRDEINEKKDRERQTVNDLQESNSILAQELLAAKEDVALRTEEVNVEKMSAAMCKRRDAERQEALQKAAELSLKARDEASEAVDRLTQELRQECSECKKHQQVTQERDATISSAQKTKEAAEKEAQTMKDWALTLKKELGLHQHEMTELKNAKTHYDEQQMEQSREKNMKLRQELEDARRRLFAAQEKEAVQCQRADDAERMIQFTSEKAQIELDEVRRRNFEEAEACYGNAETLERTMQLEAALADRLKFDVREEASAYKRLQEIATTENAQANANQDRLERMHNELIQQMNHSKDLEEKLSSESTAAMRAVHLEFELMGEKSRTRDLEEDVERSQKEASDARERVLDLAAAAEHAQARSASLQDELRLVLNNAEKSNGMSARLHASVPSPHVLTTSASSLERTKSPPPQTRGFIAAVQDQASRPPHSPYAQNTTIWPDRTSPPVSPPPFGDPNCPWIKKPSPYIMPVTPQSLPHLDMDRVFGAWPPLQALSSSSRRGFCATSGLDNVKRAAGGLDVPQGVPEVTARSGTHTPGMASTKSTASLARINNAAESAIDTLKMRGDHTLASSVEHMRKELLSELHDAWDSIHRAEQAIGQGHDACGFLDTNDNREKFVVQK